MSFFKLERPKRLLDRSVFTTFYAAKTSNL